jgi:hypothetical protein
MYYIISKIELLNGVLTYTVDSFTQNIDIANLVKTKYSNDLGNWLLVNSDSLANGNVLVEEKFTQNEVYYNCSIETTALENGTLQEITNSNQLLWL